MSHLTREALARLVDEMPDERERTHLESCAGCRAELAALTDQRQALATLPDLEPGPDAWPALRAQLRREGLVRERRLPGVAAARAAAAMVLFLAGGAAGYLARGPADPPPSLETPSRVAGGAAPVDPAVAAAAQGATTDVEASASEAFMVALDRYMAATDAPPADPAARLAALENIVLTTAEALHEAPTDPIISSYHLSALAQRNAVLRQLSGDGGPPVF